MLPRIYIIPTRMINFVSHRLRRWTQIFLRTIGFIHPQNINGYILAHGWTQINTDLPSRPLDTIGHSRGGQTGPPRFRGRWRGSVISPTQISFSFLSVCQKRFVLFVRFVFKNLHPHGKSVSIRVPINIRLECPSVCPNILIRTVNPCPSVTSVGE